MASKNDVEQVKRLLLAVYHPHNEYLVHLDSEAPQAEHQALVAFVEGEMLFQECGNVQVVPQPNLITYTGPTMVASTLHGMAILLKKRKDWKWFINLSASDYPLMTQDDILYALSNVDGNRNFIALWPRASWKISQRTKPVVLDAGLFHDVKQPLVYLPAFRTDPTIFKLVTGSAWVTLSRPFVEYLIMGWENLPRLTLMYFANTVSSPEGYLHTVLCNSEFNKTIINTDLHYITWDTPPKQHPRTLTGSDYFSMTQSGAMFGRKFTLNASESLPVLNLIDAEILHRGEGGFSQGGWCHQAEKEQFSRGELGPSYGREAIGKRKHYLGVDLSLAGTSQLSVHLKSLRKGGVLKRGEPVGRHNVELLDSATAAGGEELAENAGESSNQLTSSKTERPGTGMLEKDWEVAKRGFGSGTPGERGGYAEQSATGVVETENDGMRSSIAAEPFERKVEDSQGSGTFVGSTLERVRKTWTRAADRVEGALSVDAERDETLDQGAALGLLSRKVLQERDSNYAQPTGAEKKANRRGCDKFDGIFFLKPSERVHLLTKVIATALKDSETDLCSIYHQPVTPKPRTTKQP